jgi:hypothetical protein
MCGDKQDKTQNVKTQQPDQIKKPTEEKQTEEKQNNGNKIIKSKPNKIIKAPQHNTTTSRIVESINVML